jgi:flagellar operon protein
MADPIRPNPAIAPPGVGATAPAARPARPAPTTGGPAFDSVLRTQLDRAEGLRFSGHALDRLAHRGIGLDQPTLARLTDGVERAAAKGSRDALVLVDQTAFVVSVRNRTVITAVGADSMKDRVFTNIDTAVIN